MNSNMQQPFKPVQVTVSELRDPDLQAKIYVYMSNYEDARKRETEAQNAVVLANAELLKARANRSTTKLEVVKAFAIESEKVAMEPGWEPFRNANNEPTIEILVSERDQRNFHRMQRAQANQSVDLTKYGSMFEGETEE